jgi:hypothetical protein
MPQVQEVIVRLTQDRSNATLLQVAHVQEQPGADGASLGIISVEVDGAGSQSGNDVGGSTLLHGGTWQRAWYAREHYHRACNPIP